MVKDIMARRTSDNEVKKSFVFPSIIIYDLLAFINFLIMRFPQIARKALIDWNCFYFIAIFKVSSLPLVS